ncbi:hypothetical protein [Arthrobacter sp. UYCo732]|uniref:hypothetical protein n=1 Tax=Arthrobacter sp. UYCo732 TaxID=3156336 RepID=UPI00339982CB
MIHILFKRAWPTLLVLSLLSFLAGIWTSEMLSERFYLSGWCSIIFSFLVLLLSAVTRGQAPSIGRKSGDNNEH